MRLHNPSQVEIEPLSSDSKDMAVKKTPSFMTLFLCSETCRGIMYLLQDICTHDMLPINGSDLVLHRGAAITMSVHVYDLAHLLLVLLASMIVVTSSTLPRARAVCGPMLHIVSQAALSPV